MFCLVTRGAFWNPSQLFSLSILVCLLTIYELSFNCLFLYCQFFKVSVLDSVVQGGDSVWEGLRIYKGKIFKLEEHLDRLVSFMDIALFNRLC